MAIALRGRDWFGVAVEVLAVVLGILLGMQAASWAERRQEDAHRDRVIASLETVLDRFAERGLKIGRDIDSTVERFERARAGGSRPPPPFFEEVSDGRYEGERPPSSLWSALVATGAANRMEPERLLELTLFFDRADSFGDRYIRYNAFTEERILPYVERPEHFYEPGGGLRPEFTAHVARLRGIGAAARVMSAQASTLSRALQADR